MTFQAESNELGDSMAHKTVIVYSCDCCGEETDSVISVVAETGEGYDGVEKFINREQVDFCVKCATNALVCFVDEIPDYNTAKKWVKQWKRSV